MHYDCTYLTSRKTVCEGGKIKMVPTDTDRIKCADTDIKQDKDIKDAEEKMVGGGQDPSCRGRGSVWLGPHPYQ